MGIARRTGGGRGVYEIAGATTTGLASGDLLGREIVFELSPELTLPSGVVLELQGGKHRLHRGCFWHAHDCLGGRIPKSNTEYWKTKLARTLRRDELNDAELGRMGWRLFVIWECEVKSERSLSEAVGAIRHGLTAV